MEANTRWALIAAVAPVTWGSTYLVTAEYLPADSPLYGAALRALPAGLLLLALRRRLPQGAWWWRSLVLGTLNMGAFFALVYVAAQLLPASIASTIMATSPVAMMLIAWSVIAERPKALGMLGAVLGVGGVAVMLLGGSVEVRWAGVAASVTAMAMSSFGYILAKKWGDLGGADVLSQTAWQLVAGGAMLVPVAVLVEGAPPALDAPALVGFAYLSFVGTALAYVCWFGALRHLGAGTVGLVGLLNPVTGVLLGTLVAGETLTLRQGGGLVLVLAGILLGQPMVAARLQAIGQRARTARDAGAATEDTPLLGAGVETSGALLHGPRVQKCSQDRGPVSRP